MVPTTYQDFTPTLDRRGRRRAGSASGGSTTPCPRILTQKFRLGLFEKPYADTSGAADDRLGRAPRGGPRRPPPKSQVLLKNDGRPAAADADPEGVRRRLQRRRHRQPDRRLDRHLAGLLRRHHHGHDDPGGHAQGRRPRHLLQGRLRPTDGYDVGVVVVGETPYAEGVGDVGNGHDLELSAADKAAVDKVCARDEVRGADRLRAPPADRRPARRDRRPGGLLAARHRGRRRRRRALRQAGRSPASCRSPGRSPRPSCRSTSATRRTTRSTRTAGASPP